MEKLLLHDLCRVCLLHSPQRVVVVVSSTRRKIPQNPLNLVPVLETAAAEESQISKTRCVSGFVELSSTCARRKVVNHLESPRTTVLSQSLWEGMKS